MLVVDDDVDLGKVLVALLSRQGYACQYARSGSEALALLENRPFDLVISDLRMPGMDGITLLAEVGQKWPSVPVILLTAHGLVPAAVEAMRAGALDFLLKPFDPDELSFVVGKAMTATVRERQGPPPAHVDRPDLVGDPDTGVIAGGVVTTLLDHACGQAVFAALMQFTSIATLDLRIDYMRAAEPGLDVYARAHCYKLTRSIAFVRATAYDRDPGDPVATAQAAFMLNTSGPVQGEAVQPPSAAASATGAGR